MMGIFAAAGAAFAVSAVIPAPLAVIPVPLAVIAVPLAVIAVPLAVIAVPLAVIAVPLAVIPAKAGTHLLQPPEMGPRLRGDDGKKPDPAIAKVAAQFEALFVAQMLKSARAAALGDDLTGKGGATFTDLADQLRAEALARQAPLGVARILAAGAAAPPPPRIVSTAKALVQ